MGSCFSSSSSSSSSRTRMVDYYSAVYDYDKVFPPYDLNYASDMYLQEALASSLVSATAEINNHHPQLQRHIAPRIMHKEEETEIKTANEPAEPSSRLCMICMDENSSSDIFRGTTDCTHSYCTECTARYVAIKIEENAAMIKCPDMDCTHLIQPYTCRDLIPKDVFERWDKALCEALIMSAEKVYCPFENCSAMMVVDDDDKVTETECPSCHRLFCAQCEVTWHAGIGCEEFKRLGDTSSIISDGILSITKGKGKKTNSDEEDALLIQLATKQKWKRCPKCRYYVEKVVGCMHINCRCGFQFCYGCGSDWSGLHLCRIVQLFRA